MRVFLGKEAKKCLGIDFLVCERGVDEILRQTHFQKVKGRSPGMWRIRSSKYFWTWRTNLLCRRWVRGMLENKGVAILTCPDGITDFWSGKADVRVSTFLIGEGCSSLRSSVEGLFNLLVDDLAFFKIEGTIAVCVSAVDKVSFQEDFTMPFDDIVHVREDTINISSFAAEMMRRRLIECVTEIGFHLSKNCAGQSLAVMSCIRPSSPSEPFTYSSQILPDVRRLT